MQQKNRKKENPDMQDNSHDQERLQPETTNIDLPEVKDIPGQEHIKAPPLGEMADATASSDDEEGRGLLDDLNREDEEEPLTGDTADVTGTERELLKESAEETPGDEGARDLKRGALDTEDEEGEPLNEGSLGSDVSGADLDIPGGELDDRNAAIGEEDEENNSYSVGGDRND